MSAQLCEEQKDLGSGDSLPISAAELQNNKQFKGVRVCMRLKARSSIYSL